MRKCVSPVLVRAIFLVLLLAAVFTLDGCLIMARRQKDQPITDDNVAELRTGMSKNEVTRILGAPQEIIFSNKEHDPLREHAYVYEFTREAGTILFLGVVNFGNLDSKRDRVVVFFNESGEVGNIGKSLHGEDAQYGFPFGE